MGVLSKMFGRKVASVTNPGSSPVEGLASSEGIVISDESGGYGSYWVIQWTNGELAGIQENIPKHSLKEPGIDNGIGVYLLK